MSNAPCPVVRKDSSTWAFKFSGVQYSLERSPIALLSGEEHHETWLVPPHSPACPGARLAGSRRAQGTPPPPTPTLTLKQELAKVCLNGNIGDCFAALSQMRALWLVIPVLFVVIGGVILWAYSKGWLKRVEKEEKDTPIATFLLVCLMSSALYLEQARSSYRYFKIRRLEEINSRGSRNSPAG